MIMAVLTLLSLIILIFTFEPKKTNYYFMVLLILLAVANGGYWAVAMSSTVEEAILANKISYIGGCFTPVVTLFLVCDICNFKVPTWVRRGIYTYSFLVYAMVLTIGFNPLYYKETYLEKWGNATVLSRTYGVGHAFFYIILYGYLVLAAVLLIYSLLKKPAISRKNLYALLAMGASSVVLFMVGRWMNPAIEIMPFVYVINSWIFLYLYRRGVMYSVEDNITASVERQETSGYIMLDKHLNYLGCNGMAEQIFPSIRKCIVDRPIHKVTELSVILDWVKQYVEDKEANISYQKDNRHYECCVAETWYRRKHSGYILELREDTDKWNYMNLLASQSVELENKVNEQTEELQLQKKKIQKLLVQTVTALSEAVDAKDRYTSGHSKRVAQYALLIAARMGKSKEEQEEIYRAGLLHDVGKIRIPAEIINKPGRLTEEEYNIIKLHPITGYHILRGISDNRYIAVGAKYHHERYDGKGYPNGLAGEKIPEVARILGVADAYDAMASNRSYRSALPQEVVRAEIEKGKGTQFDPEIADIMLQMIDEDKEYSMKETDSLHKRILTVDDEAMNNKIITHIMKDEPMYEVISAGNGREALELLEQQKIDLILLDVKMPEMDGLETLQLIREKYQVPVVLMTGDKSSNISADFASYGCDDYITKPFLPLMVKEIVHNMTERTNIKSESELR